MDETVFGPQQLPPGKNHHHGRDGEIHPGPVHYPCEACIFDVVRPPEEQAANPVVREFAARSRQLGELQW